MNRNSKRSLVIVGFIIFGLGFFNLAQAAPRLRLAETDWSFKPQPVLPGQETVIYLRLQNLGYEDVEGYVQLSDNGTGLGQERAFSSRAGGAPEEVWFRWRPAAGTHELKAVATDQTRQELSLAGGTYRLTVVADNDRDGISDEADPDDDNDGLTDIYEITYDLNPLSPQDKDLDPDSDTLMNIREFFLGTDPHKKDTDGDGVNDAEDPAPRDPKIPEKSKPVVAAPVVASGSGVPPTVIPSKVEGSELKFGFTDCHPGEPTCIGSIGSRTVDSIASLQNDTPSPPIPNFARSTQTGGEKERGHEQEITEPWLSAYGLDVLGITIGAGVLLAAGFWIFKTARTET